MPTGGADIIANEIANNLLQGEDFTFTPPDLDDDKFQIPEPSTTGIFAEIIRLNNDDLTTGVITGSGTFDALMRGFKGHLKEEFERDRITGEQYAKAYVALTEGAMGNAVQFLLGRDAAYWTGVAAQMQARQAEIQLVTARVLLETEKAKLQMLGYEALNAKANYLITKMRLATESVNYDTAKYNLDQMLPLQKAQIVAETAGVTARTAQTNVQTDLIIAELAMMDRKSEMLAKQILHQIAETANLTKQGVLLDNEIAMNVHKVSMILKQIAQTEAQTLQITKQTEQIQAKTAQIPVETQHIEAQTDMIEAQILYLGKQGLQIDKDIALHPTKEALLKEQLEAQRAQTMDTRTDGTPITGSVGKQKELYDQQIESYQRDAEMKASKVFIDAWVTMKTIDEGLAPPTGFSNANLDAVLTKLKTNNGL